MIIWAEKYGNESKIFTVREINVTIKPSLTLTTNKETDLYASTTVNQPTATTSAAYPSAVAPSTVNEQTVRRPCRHNITIMHAKFGHKKLFKIFTSVAVTNNSTATAKTIIDCGSTIDFVSRVFFHTTKDHCKRDRNTSLPIIFCNQWLSTKVRCWEWISWSIEAGKRKVYRQSHGQFN